MGAKEALHLLDVLRKDGLLSRQNAAQYILHTLYGGSDMREGTQDYDALEESFYRKVFTRMLGKEPETDDAGQDKLSPEAGDYLRRVIASICDRKHGLSRFDGPYNGYSMEAYQEVRSLLGSRGIRYLGISDLFKTLDPSPSRISEILRDDDEPTQQNKAELPGPESILNDLKRLIPDNMPPSIDSQVDVPPRNTQDIGCPNEPFPGAIILLECVKDYNR
jgi:hypothetical protein